MSMLSLTASAIRFPFLYAGRYVNRSVLPRPVCSSEVTHVYTKGPAYSHSRDQWLMKMPEISSPRLHVPDVLEKILTATFGLLCNRVEAQLRNCRRDVRTEDIALAEVLDLGAHLGFGDFAGNVHGRRKCAADKPKSFPVEGDHCPVGVSDMRVCCSERRHDAGAVDIAEDQICGIRQEGKDVLIFLSDTAPDFRPDLVFSALGSFPHHPPGLVEVALRPQADDLGNRRNRKHLGQDSGHRE